MSDWVRHGECNGCGACCRTLATNLTIRFEPSITERTYLEARGLRLHPDRTIVATGDLVAPCPQLTGDGCRLHGTPQKPQWCQDYPTAPEQIVRHPCSYWFERDGVRVGGQASPYPVEVGHR